MKTTQSAQVTIKHDTTVSDLIQWLGKRPSQAKVSLHFTPGDRPFDSGQDSLMAIWEEDES